MLGRALLALVLLGATACSGGKAPGEKGVDDPSIAPPNLPEPMEASVVDDDGGALDPAERQNDGGVSDGGHVELSDAGAVNCTGPLASGDVKVVEIMISSQSGSGDRGEWVELQSTRSCILDIKGLTVSSPRGTTTTDSAEVTTDVYIQPGGSFVVADSSVSTDNHGLPNATLVATWNTYDVLKNTGDTIDITAGSTSIDSLTYPQFTLTPGRSISFPANCAWSDRASWTRWSMSFNVWDSPFEGTPGADNSDVSCY